MLTNASSKLWSLDAEMLSVGPRKRSLARPLLLLRMRTAKEMLNAIFPFCLFFFVIVKILFRFLLVSTNRSFIKAK